MEADIDEIGVFVRLKYRLTGSTLVEILNALPITVSIYVDRAMQLKSSPTLDIIEDYYAQRPDPADIEDIEDILVQYHLENNS